MSCKRDLAHKILLDCLKELVLLEDFTGDVQGRSSESTTPRIKFNQSGKKLSKLSLMQRQLAFWSKLVVELAWTQSQTSTRSVTTRALGYGKSSRFIYSALPDELIISVVLGSNSNLLRDQERGVEIYTKLPVRSALASIFLTDSLVPDLAMLPRLLTICHP
eukprot:TRINITY_DN113_c0_g1_i2.p1 TRINITY_DN113_c0_g1~~TRINITY_DN113_c0_g1_i2.p1  ORF type:complete len:162 (-),score=24.61 TRINITY_DN113_c0_g1_i2:455-940(-)